MTTFSTPVPNGTAFQRVAPSAPVPLSPALRFSQDPLVWLGLPAGTAISAFANASVVRATGASDGIPGNATSAWTAFQLSPVPTFDRMAFNAIPGGLPVMMVLVTGSVGPSPATDDLLLSGASFLTAPSGTGATAFLAFAFQDRLCRDPLSAAEAIALSAACDAMWPQFVSAIAALAGARNLRVLDHRGVPFTQGPVEVSIDGGAAQTVSLGNASDGDTGIAVAAVSAATVAFPNYSHAVIAAVDADAGVFAGPTFTLATGARLVQVLEADAWLADPDTGVQVQRWNPNSFMEPLQEGNTYFARLVDDLRAAKPNGAVEMAGWAFVKGSLDDSTIDWPLIPGDATTTLLALITELRTAGVDVRLLVNKFMQYDTSTFDDLPELLPILFVIFIMVSPVQTLLGMQSDTAGYVIGAIAVTALTVLLTSPVPFDLASLMLEYSKPLKDALDAIDPTIATWTPYPAAFSDNPLVFSPYQVLSHTIDDVSHLGVYHQKYVVAHKADGSYVGYLGGIDLNSDRVDTTLHRAKHPFHDVQVRVTGPAVQDLILSYAERATLHAAHIAIAPPNPAIGPAGSHLVQIARTYFRTQTTSATTPLTFAPRGESTPARTLHNAIENARDFIYIEDQYFTPPDDYVQALLDAADPARNVRALFITTPMSTDQPYGQVRRADVLNALQNAWGARFFAGTPLRRFMHETPSLTTNLGRMYLTAPLGQGDAAATLGAYAHLPPPPFWAFIGNELVLVHALHGAPAGSGATATQQVEIVRATIPGWGAQPVAHPIGTPVLAVQIPGIYVHAKVTVVDDVFVLIGSSNINRRGLYHDGELNSFTIPQHLRSDPTNPARIIRCRLMAEHLGLTPEMGQALFADPASAISYFTSRTWYEGSRRQALSFFGSLPPDVPIGLSASIPGWTLQQLLGATREAAQDDVWKLLSDPTTLTDPSATVPGPHYP